MHRKAGYSLSFLLAVLLLLSGCSGPGGSYSSSSATGSGGGTGGGGTGGGGAGLVSVNWTAPLGRSNGSPVSLSEIAGYKIYYGTTANGTTVVITIPDGRATSYQVSGLVSGTLYYFRMSSYDIQGVEGVLSDTQSLQAYM